MRSVPSRPPARGWAGRYGLAVVAVGSAAGYTAVVSGATAVTPFVLFAAAVAVVAVRAGFWPGAAAVVLSALLSDFLFLDPRHELTLGWGTAYLAVMYTAGVAGHVVAAARAVPGPHGRPRPACQGRSGGP